MSTWINKIVQLHPTDETVPALLVYQLERVEIYIYIYIYISLNGSQLQKLSVEYLRLYEFGHFHHAWYFNWYALEIQYHNIFISKQKHGFSLMFLFASIKLLSETQFCLSNLMSRQLYVLQGWAEMGHIFSPENVGQLFSYYYISGKPEYIYPEKQQDNSGDNGPKHMEGMVQEEGMLDKICIVHWMSLPNTPILWTTSIINCTILSQEICFRATQCYKCRLLVRGERDNLSKDLTGFQVTW